MKKLLKTKKLKITLIIFILGLFIRFLLMPFALQADLISMSYRASLMSDQNLWGIETNQNFSHYVYAINLKIIEFFSNKKAFDYYPYPFGYLPGSSTSSVGDWLNFVSHPQLNAFIFFLKVPHLLADIAVFWILAKIFKKNDKKNLILSLWFFNPVNIYAFYIFSRHDAFTLLTLLLTILFLAKDKILGSILSFFAAIQVRFQPLFYLPLYLIHSLRNSKINQEFWKKTITAIGVILILILIEKKLPYDYILFEQIKSIPDTYITNAPGVNNLIDKIFYFTISIGGKTSAIKLMLTIITYSALLLFYYFIKKAKNFKEAFLNLSLVSYLALAIYFVINDFSPHYFVWLSLFASINVLISKNFLYLYLISILGWGIMGLTDTGNFAITQHLFLPISPWLFNTPLVAQSLPFASDLFVLGRIIFNVSLILSSYEIILYFYPKIDKKLDFRKFFFSVTLLLSIFKFISVEPVQAAKYPVFASKRANFIEGQYRYLTAPKVELKPGMIYRRIFISPVNSFAAIDFRFDTSRDQNEKEILFRIKKEGAEDWHFEHIYDAKDFYNNAYYPFGFSPFEGVRGDKFVFEIQVQDRSELPLYLYQNDFILSEERPSRELLELVQTDLERKTETQKNFFDFWKLLLLINLGAFLFVVFVPFEKKK